MPRKRWNDTYNDYEATADNIIEAVPEEVEYSQQSVDCQDYQDQQGTSQNNSNSNTNNDLGESVD